MNTALLNGDSLPSTQSLYTLMHMAKAYQHSKAKATGVEDGHSCALSAAASASTSYTLATPGMVDRSTALLDMSLNASAISITVSRRLRWVSVLSASSLLSKVLRCGRWRNRAQCFGLLWCDGYTASGEHVSELRLNKVQRVVWGLCSS